MVAWYTARDRQHHHIYQAFLASYGTSNFAATADRPDRSRARALGLRWGRCRLRLRQANLPVQPARDPERSASAAHRHDAHPDADAKSRLQLGRRRSESQFGGHRSSPRDHPSQSGGSTYRPESRYRSRTRGHDKPKDTSGNDGQNRPAVPTATKPNRAAAPTATIPVAPAGTTMIPPHARDQQRRSEQCRARDSGETDHVTGVDGHRPAGVRCHGNGTRAWEAAAARRACRTGAGCTDLVDERRTPAKVGPWRGATRLREVG